MPYYKDKEEKLHFIDSEEYEYLLPAGFIRLNDSDAQNHILQSQQPQQPSSEKYKQAVQAHMDNLASSFGYDDIKSAVTYAEEPAVPKFQTEGKSFRAWRSLCWKYCYEQLDKVQNKERTVPTVEELVAELPEFVLLQG